MNSQSIMFDKKIISCIVGVLMSGTVLASDIVEREDNHPVTFAQSVIPGVGDTNIIAVMGVVNGDSQADLDFYRVYARAGDVITVDVDGGMGGLRSVDTTVAIFTGSSDRTMLRMNDDFYPVDPGSEHRYDARIENFVAPKTGNYYIGVSHYPRYFSDGAITEVAFSNGANVNGDYKLVVSGIRSPVKHVSIDVKPGNNKPSPFNPRAKGVVPVAILASENFDPMQIDVDSLTFGHSGNEQSMAKCNKFGRDVNKDRKLDLVCHYHTQAAKFVKGDLEAILKGKLKDGTDIEGRGLLKIVPEKAE